MPGTPASRWRFLLLLPPLAGAAPAAALDALALETGITDRESVLRGGLSARWLLRGDLAQWELWRLAGYAELAASWWDGDPGRVGNGSLAALGAVGVLRLERDGAGAAPYLEFGTGPHLQSDTKIERWDFDTAFAFGTHLGLGLRFGADRRWELGYRYQHLSNAGLGEVNPGINFHLVRLAYRF